MESKPQLLLEYVVIQPGGAMRDDDVIARVNELGLYDLHPRSLSS